MQGKASSSVSSPLLPVPTSEGKAAKKATLGSAAKKAESSGRMGTKSDETDADEAQEDENRPTVEVYRMSGDSISLTGADLRVRDAKKAVAERVKEGKPHLDLVTWRPIKILDKDGDVHDDDTLLSDQAYADGVWGVLPDGWAMYTPRTG